MRGKKLACLTLIFMLLLAACREAPDTDPAQTPQDDVIIDEVPHSVIDPVDPSITIAIEITELPAGEYVYYGPYEVVAGNTVTRKLRAQGEGPLLTGFSPTEDYTHSYWTQVGEGETPELSHTMTLSDAEGGSYYIWVGNGSDETLSFIEGFIHIAVD